ncbi:fasciclin domain-containing protein [soil metagenome]
MFNITQVINVDKNMKTLKKGVHASDLDQLLSSSGPFTLFAPSDLAFEKLEMGLMEELLEPKNSAKLTDLLKNHIVTGKVSYNSFKNGDKLTTLNGKVLEVQVKNGDVSIGDIAILPRNAKIKNGTMHLTDTVMQ